MKGDEKVTDIVQKPGASLWPHGVKAAVSLTGDVDRACDSFVDGRIERILDALDDYKVKYTFPITSHVFLEDIDSIKCIIKHGDEIAGHGDVHEFFRGQSYKEQRKRMEKMMKMIKESSGISIKGFRAPGLKGDLITCKAANDLGLLYDSSAVFYETNWIQIRGRLFKVRNKKLRVFMSDCAQIWKSFRHLQPWRKNSLNKKKEASYLPYSPVFNGKRLKTLEIPVSSMDDYYLIDVRGYKNWKKVAKIWQSNFEDRYRKRGLFVLLAHPSRIGRKKYIKALRSFIEHAIKNDDVWFATLTELTKWWKSRNKSIHDASDSP